MASAEACLQNANIPQVAIDKIKESTNNFSRLQCVGFISAIEAATGGNLQNISYANAKSYFRYLPGYIQYIRVPGMKNDLRQGDILIWTNHQAGHMAMVTDVVFDPSGQLVKIVIAEALGDSGLVQTNEITYDNPGLAGWQRRQ